MKSSTHTAGCNFFWVGMWLSGIPGVPVRLAAVQQLAKNLFAEPTPFACISVSSGATSRPHGRLALIEP